MSSYGPLNGDGIEVSGQIATLNNTTPLNLVAQAQPIQTTGIINHVGPFQPGQPITSQMMNNLWGQINHQGHGVFQQAPVKPQMTLQEQVTELAKQIYLQKISLPVTRAELPELVKQSFEEAHQFIMQSVACFQDLIRDKSPPPYGDIAKRIDWQGFKNYAKVGKRIEAMKEYRTITNHGLKEATEYLTGYENYLKNNPQYGQAYAVDAPSIIT